MFGPSVASAPPDAKRSGKPLTIDLVFVMDCTASMDPWINAARDKLQSIVSTLKGSFANLELRVGFVGYRDFKDPKPFEIHDLSSEVDTVVRFISTVKPSGGGDPAEDVLGGLEKASKLAWSGKGRRLIMFGDAPGHGRLYNDWGTMIKNDAFPDFDADGAIGKKLIKDFAKQRVDMTFVQMTKNTVKMTDLFQEWYNSSPYKNMSFQVLDLGADTSRFLEEISLVVTSTIQSVSAGMSALLN